MIKELVKLANDLDKKGLRKEADFLDAIIVKAQRAQDEVKLFNPLSEWPKLKQALMESISIETEDERDIDHDDIKEAWNKTFKKKDGMPDYQMTLDRLIRHLRDTYKDGFDKTEGIWIWNIRELDNAFGLDYSQWKVRPELGDN